jgi:hypothetical protein
MRFHQLDQSNEVRVELLELFGGHPKLIVNGSDRPAKPASIPYY